MAIRRVLSIATKVKKPTMIPRPRRRLRFGSTITKRTWSGESSPRKISGSKWKMVSPRRPPTANATMTDREEGSMFGGHRARRKSSAGDMVMIVKGLMREVTY